MIINTDGGSRGNPGPGACGAVLKDRNGNIVAQKGKFLGVCTNNEAEYQGLILGLETALEMGADTAEILMDSELVVKQLKGQYRVKNAKLFPLYQQVKGLGGKIGQVSYRAVPREQNKLADAVVNKVLDEQLHA
ncbi:ribonuclease H [candidate division WWE3 bacterium CG08_land_8_20_14_0_20_41_10]|uniref:Ribonuclease H n=1 Tax=candidate division WWE3 bacterium CG08_land_8_20_14_0_20_41_10 TaxID=1975085 RepID=A0A2H0XCS3_UNCKA|nr:MAG: ribonuclease H [candidate division WWE3 bacterium CG08_land_8_20_14_0_20_41_10]